jgi:uncharacterized membrane protein
MEETPQVPNAGQTLGIIALVLGIVAVILSFIPCAGIWVAVPMGILSIILGIIGIVQANKNNAEKGLPLTGLILGAVALVVTIVMYATIGAAASMFDSKMKDGSLQKDTKKMMEGAMDTVKVEIEKEEGTQEY